MCLIVEVLKGIEDRIDGVDISRKVVFCIEFVSVMLRRSVRPRHSFSGTWAAGHRELITIYCAASTDLDGLYPEGHVGCELVEEDRGGGASRVHHVTSVTSALHCLGSIPHMLLHLVPLAKGPAARMPRIPNWSTLGGRPGFRGEGARRERCCRAAGDAYPDAERDGVRSKLESLLPQNALRARARWPRRSAASAVISRAAKC